MQSIVELDDSKHHSTLVYKCNDQPTHPFTYDYKCTRTAHT